MQNLPARETALIVNASATMGLPARAFLPASVIARASAGHPASTNACRPPVTDQLANRQAKQMRRIFERFDVDIVGAAGQKRVERLHLVGIGAEFVENGESVRFRSAVLPQDRQDRGAMEFAHGAAR
jgi:hypothetical protein